MIFDLRCCFCGLPIWNLRIFSCSPARLILRRHLESLHLAVKRKVFPSRIFDFPALAATAHFAPCLWNLWIRVVCCHRPMRRSHLQSLHFVCSQRLFCTELHTYKLLHVILLRVPHFCELSMSHCWELHTFAFTHCQFCDSYTLLHVPNWICWQLRGFSSRRVIAEPRKLLVYKRTYIINRPVWRWLEFPSHGPSGSGMRRRQSCCWQLHTLSIA